MNIPKPTWRVFLAGVLGGAVDAVPSISGATVYYIVGIYRNLLESIARAGDSFLAAIRQRSFAPLQNEMAWRYLFVLKTGVILSFLSFAHVILHFLQNETFRPLLLSTFFGIVLGSAVLSFSQVLSWTRTRTTLFALGIALGLLVVSAPQLFQEPVYSVPVTLSLPTAENVSSDHKTLLHVPFSAIGTMTKHGIIDSQSCIVDEKNLLPLHLENLARPLPCQPATIVTGLVVACAMLLPGVSGSYVLNVLGYYSTVLSAIIEIVAGIFFFSFPIEAWEVILNLGAGVLIGLLVFSRVVLGLFKKHPCSTQAFVSGVMLGSIGCLWPFQKMGYIVDPLHSNQGLCLVGKGGFFPTIHDCLHSWHFFFIAFVAFSAVFLLQRMAAEKKALLPISQTE